MRYLLAATALTLCTSMASNAVADPTPPEYCQQSVDDNVARALPPEMMARGARQMGIDLPPDVLTRGVWRCMDGKVMVCITGGSRHCGRADTQVVPSPEARRYCKIHPDAAEIPTGATGRDTIFAWRCNGKEATNIGAVRTVDKRGFVKEFWRAYQPLQD